MTLRARTVAAGFLIVLCGPPPRASADPVSFRFDVNITTFGAYGGFRMPSFQPRFQLIATFDDQITSSIESTGFRQETYGHVRFSSVPLPAPAPFPNLPLSILGGPESNNGFLESDHDFFRIARLGVRQVQLEGPEFPVEVWDRFVLIEPFDGRSSRRPTLTPRSLAVAAGTPTNEPNFLYKSERPPESEFTEGVAYRGFATFVGEVEPSNPVPEPGTLLLFATGTIAIGRRVLWRRGA